MHRAVAFGDEVVEAFFPRTRKGDSFGAFVAIGAADLGPAGGYKNPSTVVITQLKGVVEARARDQRKRRKIRAKIAPGPASLLGPGRGYKTIDLGAPGENAFRAATHGNPDLGLGKLLLGRDEGWSEQKIIADVE